MIVVALTGGVACGKTLVSTLLQERLSAPAFNSDQCVRSLLEREEVQDEISTLLMESGLAEGGNFDKSEVRKHAFENSGFREKLEGLLHPLVYEEAIAFTKLEANRSKVLLLEVPLLYEVDFPLKRDLDLVVAASSTTQLSRLTRDRGLSLEMAQQILNAQLLIDEKICRGDVIIWNDGSLEALTSQVEHLAHRCSPLFNQ